MADVPWDDERPVRVAVDLMGSDVGPEPVVGGALDAVARLENVACVLVGTGDALRDREIAAARDRVSTMTVTEEITMAEDPAVAIRQKRDSSTVRAMGLLKAGDVDAVVTAASTGAVVLAAGALLRRTPGALHPALATILTSRQSPPKVLVDCGATTRREPRWLAQFGTFGAAVAGTLLGCASPTVGLLANGVESVKGDTTIRDTHGLLGEAPGYVGLVEPDALYAPTPDVIVTDGLLGNVVLKAVEATFRAVARPLMAELAALAERMGEPIDLSPLGRFRHLGHGAVLVGVNGVVVKAHGSATRPGVTGAITLAVAAARADLPDRIAVLVAGPTT